MAALHFLVNSVLSFAVYCFLFRVLLPLVRADFRNPLSQAILALTNWLVMPLRRILPPVGRVDSASIIALLAIQIGATLIAYRLAYDSVLPALPLLVLALRMLLATFLLLYTVLIFIYALLSFVAPGARSPATSLLASLCEPVLGPVRRLLPTVGGLDLSPLVAIVGLQALRLLII
ncbi:MAG: YggT family protein [Steroidobacteraceae bacterium]